MRFYLLVDNKTAIGREGGFTSKSTADQMARVYFWERGVAPQVLRKSQLPAGVEFRLCEHECWNEPETLASCGFVCAKK